MGYQKYTRGLWLLLAAFCFRVFAQLIQRFADVRLLPPFSEWDSGYLPYPLLVLAQLSIAAVMLWTILHLKEGRLRPRHGVGVGLLMFGVVYFLGMFVRFVIAVAGVSDAVFFQLYIPAFFHLVLASFVLLVGTYHVRNVA